MCRRSFTWSWTGTLWTRESITSILWTPLSPPPLYAVLRSAPSRKDNLKKYQIKNFKECFSPTLWPFSYHSCWLPIVVKLGIKILQRSRDQSLSPLLGDIQKAGGPVRQPSARVDYMPQSGTKTLATDPLSAYLFQGPNILNLSFENLFSTCASSLGRYVFGSEISYNKAPPRLPGLGC